MKMIKKEFVRAEHVYRNDAFTELVKDAVRFFNGTPVHHLPPPSAFNGSGVYALYYTGHSKLYEVYRKINRLSYGAPIYVGKAVPKGWRQSRTIDNTATQSNELYTRLRQHSKSIADANNLELVDFTCRFVIFEDAGSDMIATVESILIKLFTPLWNVHLDGFGNHDPGKGRYAQAKSDWDVIHPGRSFAAKCTGTANEKSNIIKIIQEHMSELGE